ncbi:Kelch repeat protein [Aspergillus novofumigatus IBT 16806]|uniref:Kelch repeat protein n=1 Tax=Aspergillus novofumigatus (strain IBT 16806) TaxID=1392255 RepID=A0A2I1CIX1_ASPN1|nr:kelch repeat protein [Aspergillus novofumigatus IBT 16806]PKX97573.1 kelch repeat protein [Aspergillus novofumigatus IBT 16806]
MVATQVTGKWTKVLDAESLQRSSQVLAVVDNMAHVFGGELRPREPRDNDVHTIALNGTNPTSTIARPSTSQVPSPRVGSASTTLGKKIYLFSGRGGAAMAPIDEAGAVWEFNPQTSAWRLITYHCMTSDGTDTLYLHAGCPETGRLSDLWAFRLSTREWTALASAPDPPRGGTSIAFADGALYRMNGFDGKNEQGGSVDVYSPEANAWSSYRFVADGVSGPEARSVSALLPVRIGVGDPSALGHQGAGKMLGDVWVFDMEERSWRRVDAQGAEAPCARGWFAADVLGENAIVVQGGLDESNGRLGDVWILSF